MLNRLVLKFLKVEVIMRDLEFGKDLIKKKIPLISNSPGVYRMLGKKSQVLYVGKAKNLPNRLKDYAMKKLQEEVQEFVEDPCAAEAADIMEIFHFVCNRMGIKDSEIMAATTTKRVSKRVEQRLLPTRRNLLEAGGEGGRRG